MYSSNVIFFFIKYLNKGAIHTCICLIRINISDISHFYEVQFNGTARYTFNNDLFTVSVKHKYYYLQKCNISLNCWISFPVYCTLTV